MIRVESERLVGHRFRDEFPAVEHGRISTRRSVQKIRGRRRAAPQGAGPPLEGKKRVLSEMKRYRSVEFPKKVSLYESADMAYIWNPCEYANNDEGTIKGNCLHIWKLRDKVVDRPWCISTVSKRNTAGSQGQEAEQNPKIITNNSAHDLAKGRKTNGLSLAGSGRYEEKPKVNGRNGSAGIGANLRNIRTK